MQEGDWVQSINQMGFGIGGGENGKEVSHVEKAIYIQGGRPTLIKKAIYIQRGSTTLIISTSSNQPIYGCDVSLQDFENYG